LPTARNCSDAVDAGKARRDWTVFQIGLYFQGQLIVESADLTIDLQLNLGVVRTHINQKRYTALVKCSRSDTDCSTLVSTALRAIGGRRQGPSKIIVT